MSRGRDGTKIVRRQRARGQTRHAAARAARTLRGRHRKVGTAVPESSLDELLAALAPVEPWPDGAAVHVTDAEVDRVPGVVCGADPADVDRMMIRVTATRGLYRRGSMISVHVGDLLPRRAR